MAAKEERKRDFGFQRFFLLTFTLVTEHHMESSKQTCSFIFNYRRCLYMLSQEQILLVTFFSFE